MSLSTQTLKRLRIIKESLREGLNRDQIGLKCGVTEKTIDRDVSSWVKSGLFDIWIKEEFVDLHNYARDSNPMEAYKQITKIVSKMVTRRAEIKTKEELEIKAALIVKMWKPQDDPAK